MQCYSDERKSCEVPASLSDWHHDMHAVHGAVGMGWSMVELTVQIYKCCDCVGTIIANDVMSTFSYQNMHSHSLTEVHLYNMQITNSEIQ